MNRIKRLRTAMTLALAVLASSPAVSAGNEFANYFTMGVNDTVTVTRDMLGGSLTIPVKARFTDLVDHWAVTLTYPDGLVADKAESGLDMTIPYTGSQGENCVCVVPLTSTSDMKQFMAMTTVYGYFLYGGSYFQYGTVKWEPGAYDGMFYLTLMVGDNFSGGTLTMNGTVSSGYDHRYGSSGMSTVYYKTIHFTVESLIGDVNGDGVVNITDVTLLTGFLLSSSAPVDATAQPAADLDGNGVVNITDVTMLISQVLNGK